MKDIFLAYIAYIAFFPLSKNVNFSTFWPSCFYSPDWRFFVLQHHKRHFPDLYCLKKKNFEKWLFLDENDGLTPLEKSQFSTIWTSCFYSLERRFFVLEYHKDIFLAFIAPPPPKKNGKWPFLHQINVLTSLEKMSLFGLF